MLLLLASLASAEPVRGYADLHIHIGAHLAVPVYGEGPDAAPPEHFRYRHALRPQIFADDLAGSGPTIFVSMAYANPFATVFETRASMRARIERQLDAVESFCAHHADRFTLAHTPEEARTAITGGQTVIIHGIEGATKILGEPGDAARWAARGIAVVTPIHLADNALGGALCQEGALGMLNVLGCLRQGFAPRRHGLTPEGSRAVASLIDAGVVIDLAHTSPQSFDDLLPLLAERSVAPLYTHITSRAVREDPGALTDTQITAIYALGGLAGVTANLHSVSPRPVPEALPATRCRGSVDDLRLQWEHIAALTAGAPLAWGSDFQGGIAHLRPRYGPDGCADVRPDGAPLNDFDVEGLSRPGLVGAMFDDLAREGMDRRPLDASAERLLTVWEQARAAGR